MLTYYKLNITMQFGKASIKYQFIDKYLNLPHTRSIIVQYFINRSKSSIFHEAQSNGIESYSVLLRFLGEFRLDTAAFCIKQCLYTGMICRTDWLA